MHTSRHLPRRLVAALLAAFAAPAHATTSYCAGSVAQIQNALDQAELDNDDSLVRIRSGSYALAGNLVYQPDLEYVVDAGKLTVRGGYNSDCSSYSTAQGATTFSGAGRGLRLFTETSDVSLAGLTFNSAYLELSGEVANGSLVDECSILTRTFALRRIRVDQASAEVEAPCQDVIVENSLFTNGARQSGSPHGADTALGVQLYGFDDGGDPASLTLVNTTVAAARTSVLTCCGDGPNPTARFYNSIFNRTAGDDLFTEASVLALNNRYDGITFLGTALLLPGSASNVSANPGLDPQYVPDPGSPMIDSGTANVPGGLADTDLSGGERVIGARVDRGALESPVDGTGVFTVTNANASGAGSLANEVALANADNGANTIRFAIPGTCPRRITVDSALQVRETLLIDGWSQPSSVLNTDEIGFDGVPCVLLDGSDGVGVGIETLADIGTGRLTVRGLAFEDFSTAILLPYGADHAIQGNQFGGRIGATGPILAGNDTAITLAGARSFIGGLSPASRNLIGDSADAGILVTGSPAEDNEILNNLIGLDRDGIAALPNLDGVRINGNDNRIAFNRIGGNSRDGVVLRSSSGYDNVVESNWIGGNQGLLSIVAPNGRAGVLLEAGAYRNRIGPGNFMWRNGDSAVRVLATADGLNEITANEIDRNDSPGIDLGANGVDANDFDPLACGSTGCAANRGQNFPVLTDVGFAPIFPIGRPIAIEGRLTSTVGTYRVELFASDACYSAGNGQGARFLGNASVSIVQQGVCANNNCTGTFTAYVPESDLEYGDVVAATATSPGGNTSEFSACLEFEQPVGPDLVFRNGFE